MNTPSFRDIELLSAYLDGNLSGEQLARLEARLKAEPELTEALVELRQVRSLLRKTPKHRVPRNFTLTPKMAGIRPPVPRVVPALSWAGALAGLMFFFTLGINLLGGALPAATKASDMYALGAGAPQATQAPAGLAPMAPQGTTVPQATQDAMTENALTATPEVMTASGVQATESAGARTVPPARPAQPVSKGFPWLYFWLGLALVMAAAALAIRWQSRMAFLKRVKTR